MSGNVLPIVIAKNFCLILSLKNFNGKRQASIYKQKCDMLSGEKATSTRKEEGF